MIGSVFSPPGPPLPDAPSYPTPRVYCRLQDTVVAAVVSVGPGVHPCVSRPGFGTLSHQDHLFVQDLMRRLAASGRLEVTESQRLHEALDAAVYDWSVAHLLCPREYLIA